MTIKAHECECHNEPGSNHEACCGHEDGRNLDCPFHGDGSGPNSFSTPIKKGP